MKPLGAEVGPPTGLGRFLRYSLGGAILWWLLTGGRADSWSVGLPVVLLAASVSLMLGPTSSWRLTLTGLLHFVPYFLYSSLLGGLDVAVRALHPRLPIAPQMIDYQLRLPPGTARVFFMNVTNLLPGTVSADYHGNTLRVHVIDERRPMRERLVELEHRVATLFAIDLSQTEAMDAGPGQ